MYQLVCPFNRMVDCEEAKTGLIHLAPHCKCMKCGWNPEVSAKRVKRVHTYLQMKEQLRNAGIE